MSRMKLLHHGELGVSFSQVCWICKLADCDCRNGETVEYRSEQIPQSDYHIRLGEYDFEYPSTDDSVEREEAEVLEESKIRYWSDYSRVSFHQRSVQRLSGSSDWEDMDGDWVAGSEAFRMYDDVRRIGLSSLI